MQHHPDDLIMLFNDLFRARWRTELVRGEDEPEYIPAADSEAYHRVVFAHGYFASALHEISHWCIAGEKRRQLYDYGYWYCPDGRTGDQQAAFESVEVKPQALEWLFSEAAGRRFHISVDNLSGDGACDEEHFRRNVALQAQTYLAQKMPERARMFLDTLLDFYDRRSRFGAHLFQA
ncbi:elongation factor P hydroxylase [Marinobacter bohaiensis]|uniref:elongation factor P hydroxylase n=1 Tax=Marinobacter bohaiensis TaxID=2201898 RepID=UPI000DAD3063|nr:elongation factor P hydroxylase [Marinobacter bohaiensis]